LRLELKASKVSTPTIGTLAKRLSSLTLQTTPEVKHCYDLSSLMSIEPQLGEGDSWWACMHLDLTVCMLTCRHIIMHLSEGDEKEVILIAESRQEADPWIHAIIAGGEGSMTNDSMPAMLNNSHILA
jgi:hypothetical protein